MLTRASLAALLALGAVGSLLGCASPTDAAEGDTSTDALVQNGSIHAEDSPLGTVISARTVENQEGLSIHLYELEASGMQGHPIQLGIFGGVIDLGARITKVTQIKESAPGTLTIDGELSKLDARMQPKTTAVRLAVKFDAASSSVTVDSQPKTLQGNAAIATVTEVITTSNSAGLTARLVKTESGSYLTLATFPVVHTFALGAGTNLGSLELTGANQLTIEGTEDSRPVAYSVAFSLTNNEPGDTITIAPTR